VDDDRLVARAVTRMLTARGLNVTHAADGADGAALCGSRRAAGRPFDIALVDATIPGGAGGTEALALLRAAHPNLPAVLVTGHVGADATGFDASLHKPFSADDLLGTLTKLVPAKTHG
jgi:CheY-like chemotaxis protein